MSKNNSFSEKVYRAVCKIPQGKVATYGQIAEYIDCPGGARAVGTALHNNPDGDRVPCYRVVNAAGRLAPGFAFGGSGEQKRRLQADGIEVRGIYVDLEKYLWKEEEK